MLKWNFTMKSRIGLILIFSFLLCSNIVAKEYTFGIVPQQSAQKLARLWGPLLQQLSIDTGISLRFSTAKNIPTFEKRLAAGDYDFAYMNPYHYTVFHESPGYVAIAHQKNKSIQGVFVVRKDSFLSNLDDLNGATLAFPSPAAFAASLLPQAKLNNSDIAFEPRYVSSHDSVYLTVARGLVPAGGGVLRTLANTDPEIRKQLRIFWKTKKYTPHAFAAHPKVALPDREIVRTALSNLHKSARGMELLQAIKFSGIQEAQDSNWDDVRALNLAVLN